MRTSTALKVLSAVAFAALAACSGDLPSAPVTATPDLDTPSFAKGGNENAKARKGGKSRAKDAAYSSFQTFTIRVNPKATYTYRIGSHWVHIPANVICGDDSGYGMDLWDTPCASLATEPMELTVDVVHENGRSSVRFDRDLRFRPSNRKSDWVILGLKVYGDMSAELGYGILYQPTDSDQWIDESLTDSSLRAFRMKGHVVGRRLKHFSGYNVALGFTEQADPTDGALMRGVE